MSHDRQNGVKVHSASKHAARLVALALADRENDEDGQCNPSIDVLMVDTNLSRRSVQNGINWLVANGEIRIDLPGGFVGGVSRSNHYTFLLPKVDNEERKWIVRDRVQSLRGVQITTPEGADPAQGGANNDTPRVQETANVVSISAPKPEREPEGLNQKNKQKEEDLPFPEKVKREFSNWVDELTEAIGETPSGDLEKARAGYSELRAKNFTSLALSLAIRGAVGNDQVRDKAKDMVWILDPVRVEMLITMGRSTETSEPVAA